MHAHHHQLPSVVAAAQPPATLPTRQSTGAGVCTVRGCGCRRAQLALLQGRAFRAEGALGVALVNSMKGSTVAVVSSLFFCRGPQPGQCLTLASSLSAITVTAGEALLTRPTCCAQEAVMGHSTLQATPPARSAPSPS